MHILLHVIKTSERTFFFLVRGKNLVLSKNFNPDQKDPGFYFGDAYSDKFKYFVVCTGKFNDTILKQFASTSAFILLNFLLFSHLQASFVAI
jgi:hypothetical protein